MSDTSPSRTFHNPDPTKDDPVAAEWFTSANKIVFDILGGAETKTEARSSLNVYSKSEVYAKSEVYTKSEADSIDHGGLSGLGDDDHTQYLKEDGTRAMSGNLDMGSNAIANVGNVDGRHVAADGTKLDGIEVSADVTDATNVNAAGATMNTDTDVSGNSWVLDEDTMSSNSATKVPTQQSSKAYTDSFFSGVSQVQVIVKAADETVNNSSTLQNDDDLVVAIAANETITVRYVIFYNSSAAADIKYTVTAPTGATGILSETDDSVAVSLASTLTANASSGSDAAFTVHAVINNGANAGNVNFQWAQDTSDVGDTKVLANSNLVVHRVP